MRNRWFIGILVVQGFFCGAAYGQPVESKTYDNWVAFSPFTISTLFTPYPWYYFEYGHRFDSKDAMLVAVDFGKSGSVASFPDFWNGFQYPGHTDFFSVLVGYRRYLWEGFHTEGDIISGYSAFYDKDQARLARGWNGISVELKIGYDFDFSVFKVPCFVNVQLQGLFSLFNDPAVEPESFKRVDSQTSRFLLFPACQMGCRF